MPEQRSEATPRSPRPGGVRLRGWSRRASSRQCSCCRVRREALKVKLAAATVLAATTITAPSALASQPGFIPWWQAPHPKLVHKLRQEIRLRRDRAVYWAWKLGIILTSHNCERFTVDVPTFGAMDARWHFCVYKY